MTCLHRAILLHVADPALVDALAAGAGELGPGLALQVWALRLVAAIPAVILVVTPPVLGNTLTRLASDCNKRVIVVLVTLLLLDSPELTLLALPVRVAERLIAAVPAVVVAIAHPEL